MSSSSLGRHRLSSVGSARLCWASHAREEKKETSSPGKTAIKLWGANFIKFHVSKLIKMKLLITISTVQMERAIFRFTGQETSTLRAERLGVE